MNFNEFVQFDEVFDNLEAISQEDFVEDPSGSYLTYSFQIGNEPFEISFSKTAISLDPTRDNQNDDHLSYRQLKIESYSINFNGPKGTNLTNSHNSPTKIYAKLLAAIKAFIEYKKPPSLFFYGADQAMDVIYRRLVTRFFADKPGSDPYKVFYQISYKEYISKAKYLELAPPYQATVRERMTTIPKSMDANIKNIKQEKIAGRQAANKTPNNLSMYQRYSQKLASMKQVPKSQPNLNTRTPADDESFGYL